MSSALTDESPAPAKGLSSGSLGLWGNTVIGLAVTAPAYSLAATLGYVVLAVGEKSPAMFLIAFVPMLLVAIAYRELNSVMPDCGTTFTWGAKALGPWVGWLGGWGAGGVRDHRAGQRRRGGRRLLPARVRPRRGRREPHRGPAASGSASSRR